MTEETSEFTYPSSLQLKCFYLAQALGFVCRQCMKGLPGGAVMKNLPANVEDARDSSLMSMTLVRANIFRESWARQKRLVQSANLTACALCGRHAQRSSR